MIRKDLHSTMQRLKLFSLPTSSLQLPDLHSTMQRLKLSVQILVYNFLLRFTFHYAKIKTEDPDAPFSDGFNLHSTMQRLKPPMIDER